MTVDKSKHDFSHIFSLDDEEFHVRTMIPYEEKEQMA